MLISFGRKDKRFRGVIAELLVPPMPGDGEHRHSRLIDLRSAAAFSAGFVPGSYSMPDLDSLRAARAAGLFEDRSVYLLAETARQLEMCGDGGCFGPNSCLNGWFSPDALEEWRTLPAELGVIEPITPGTLAIRSAAWNTIAVEVRDNGEAVGSAPADALVFDFKQLRISLDGLPTETSLCVTCRTPELGSLAASLLWNCGFHRMAYLAY